MLIIDMSRMPRCHPISAESGSITSYITFPVLQCLFDLKVLVFILPPTL